MHVGIDSVRKSTLSLLSLTRCTLYTTLYYIIMTSLSQRLLHTSLPHRLYTKLGVRSFSVSSSNLNQNPTPSDLAHQARLLIQDAPEAVVEPERKFQANQVCQSLHPLPSFPVAGSPVYVSKDRTIRPSGN
jgi:hypothetical protein